MGGYPNGTTRDYLCRVYLSQMSLGPELGAAIHLLTSFRDPATGSLNQSPKSIIFSKHTGIAGFVEDQFAFLSAAISSDGVQFELVPLFQPNERVSKFIGFSELDALPTAEGFDASSPLEGASQLLEVSIRSLFDEEAKGALNSFAKTLEIGPTIQEVKVTHEPSEFSTRDYALSQTLNSRWRLISPEAEFPNWKEQITRLVPKLLGAGEASEKAIVRAWMSDNRALEVGIHLPKVGLTYTILFQTTKP